MGNKEHWEKVFTTKERTDVSWFQEYPKTAMDYIEEVELPKMANIIDIGGGDSNLVDALLEKGFQNIWVLDISSSALEKAKARLGEKADQVHWVVSDITALIPEIKFDFWYDRAVFHFLTEQDDIAKYVSTVTDSVVENGHFLLGTFSENGPLKCSGLEITQYSEAAMKSRFNNRFEPRKCFTESHITPFETVQHFQFCGFTKK